MSVERKRLFVALCLLRCVPLQASEHHLVSEGCEQDFDYDRESSVVRMGLVSSRPQLLASLDYALGQGVQPNGLVSLALKVSVRPVLPSDCTAIDLEFLGLCVALGN